MGWMVFAIAAVVYLSTIEPTASFWDCGEYISTSIKLQVGHPPGAPLFQMFGAVVSKLFTSDPTQMAMYMNGFSGICNAIAIMLLFWCITHFGRKIAVATQSDLSSKAVQAAVLGSGLVGALAITFSDTFWFNAVEAEVYAMTNCLTTLAFYMMLKWEDGFGEERNNKWLLLIAFIIGLSPGVRFTIMLTIPAMVMIYFFKTRESYTRKQFIIALIAAVAILMGVFQILFPFILTTFGKMEIFFVNTLGLPFNSGTFFTVVLMIALCSAAIIYTKKKKLVVWNTLALAFSLMSIGFSSYLMLSIRANAGTSINENNPSSAVTLLSYYNREQYGKLYNFYGPMYYAELDSENPYSQGAPIYEKNEETEHYDVVSHVTEYNFDQSGVKLFPRMHSREPRHVENYRKIAGLGRNEKPNLIDNIGFYLDFQANYMYFRYFMWNFVGRQNDVQGRYEPTKGNWLSGIDFIDEWRLGPQDELPADMANNKARNTYFFLPLLLGLIGAVYHFKKDPESAFAVLLFFLFTGLAVATYTNPKPFEPRERDYAMAVSFWVFGIWIGLGVWALFDEARQKLKSVPQTALAGVLTVLCLLAVPSVMASQNWDDHDRSDRYTARDMAKSYLDSCDENAILFTYGDNDTFPIWYVQEIEGYRRDVRLVNLSLLNTDWYIDQMKQRQYDTEPAPIKMPHEIYRQGTRDMVYYFENPELAQYRLNEQRWTVQQFMRWIGSNDPRSLIPTRDGQSEVMYPTKKLSIPVNKENVLKYNIVSEKYADQILPSIDFDLQGSGLEKKDLAILDILANFDWKRPVYFSVTAGISSKSFLYLDEHFQNEGLTFKVVPIKTPRQKNSYNIGRNDAMRTYEHVQKWEFGNMEKEDVYLSETDRRLSMTLRGNLARLANALYEEGETEKAVEILDLSMEKIPSSKFGYSIYYIELLESLYTVGEKEKAAMYSSEMLDELIRTVNYYSRFSPYKQAMLNGEIQEALSYYQYTLELLMTHDRENFEKYNEQFVTLIEKFK